MKKFFFAFLLLTISASIPVFLTSAQVTPPPNLDTPLSPVDANKAVLTGTTEQNAKIYVTGGLYEIPPVTASAQGKFSITVALVQESSNTYYVRSQVQGWDLSDSAEVTIVEGRAATEAYEEETGEDHTAPDAPELAESDVETSEATYLIEGAAEVGATVWVNDEVTDEMVDEDGNFTVEVSLSGGDAKDSFTISVSDESGNLSSGSKITITGTGAGGELTDETAEEKPEPIDIVGHWAESYINGLYQSGIVSGYENGLFGPDDKLTRAQIVKIALLAFGKTSEGEPSFSDVPSDAWFYDYVNTASNLGIVNGYEDKTFRPNQEVTRAEALKIILIAADLTQFTSTETNFSDIKSSDWFSAYTAYAKEIGLINGYSDGTFRGNQSITRAEVCKIVVQLLDYLETEQ